MTIEYLLWVSGMGDDLTNLQSLFTLRQGWRPVDIQHMRPKSQLQIRRLGFSRWQQQTILEFLDMLSHLSL